MKFLKGVLVFLAVVLLLLLVVALFLPSSYHVERSITIACPDSVVYEQVIDFHNWQKWDPWSEADPEATYSIQGAPRGVGSIWSWEGEIVGTGSQTIVAAEEDRMVENKLVFTQPQAMEAVNTWSFESIDGETKVIWSMHGKLDYPVGRYVGLFMEQMLGPDFEKGLKNLKRVSEMMCRL
jgi:hypothetical protein